MFKVSKTALIPLAQLNGGSVEARYTHAQKLTRQLYNEIKDEFTKSDLPYKKIKKAIIKQLPKRKCIEVKPINENGINGRVSIGSDKNKNVIGYFFHVKPNHYSKKVPFSSLGTLMHEADHLFSYFTNPKYVKRIVITGENGYRTKEYFNLFDNKIMTYKKRKNTAETLKTQLEDYFANKSNGEKINVLQDIRYRLINENNAYRTGNKYQRKAENRHIDLLSQKSEPTKTQNYQFKEKIKLISEMLLNTIKKERENIATTLQG